MTASSGPLSSGFARDIPKITSDDQKVFKQKAQINGKSVTITVEFSEETTTEVAKKAINDRLQDIQGLVEHFKLGGKNEKNETTHSLTLNQDDSLIRKFTNETADQPTPVNSQVVDGTKMQIEHLSKEQMTGIFAKIKGVAAQALEQVGEAFRSTKEALEAHDETPPSSPPTRLLGTGNGAAVPVDDSDTDDDIPILTPAKADTPQAPATINTTSPAAEVQNPAVDSASLTPQKLSRSAQTADAVPGNVFSDEFKLNGRVIAKETVVREDTVPKLFESLKAKISYLERKLTFLRESTPQDPEPITKLEALIKETKDNLAKYEASSKGATWASTNFTRFGFGAGRTVGKDDFAPVLFNLRMQTVAANGGEVVSAMSRSGAISDFSHGEVSLQELKDLEDLEKMSDPNNDLTPERQNQLRSLYLRDDAKNDIASVAFLIKTKALVGYGADALSSDISFNGHAVLEALKGSKRLENDIENLSPDEIEALNSVEIYPEKLGKVIGQRTDRLTQMALQDLELHMRTKKASKGETLYGRTALVNLQKAANNEGGCVIHERTQGLDMKAVFDVLDGKTVLFEDGVKAAFMDDEGRIHMPKECANEGLAETKLDTFFFNICVQGNDKRTKNDGMQKAINDETFQRLKAKYGEVDIRSIRDSDLQHPKDGYLKTEAPFFAKFKSSLEHLTDDKGVDPNETVLLATRFIQRWGGYTGANCYGGKDRTGYVLALNSHAHIEELGAESGAVNPSQTRAWGRQLMGVDGVAAKVAKDNANHTTLKLTRIDLKLYGVNSVKGILLRIAHVINGIGNILLKKLKGIVKLPTLPVSKTPGQLYQDRWDEKVSSTKMKTKGIGQAVLPHSLAPRIKIEVD